MSDWLSNKESTQRVKDLLNKAGMPLEMSVTNMCQQFSEKYGIDYEQTPEENWDNLTEVTASREIYKVWSNKEVSRELDQVVRITSRLKLSDTTDITLSTVVPIECKHREHIEIFGFPYPRRSRLVNAFPTISDISQFTPTRNFMNIEWGGAPGFLSTDPLCSLVFLEITRGSTPNRVFDEDIAFKAGSSLCDFVMSQPRAHVQEAAEVVAGKLGILEKFSKEYKRRIYGEDFVIDTWAEDVFSAFNKSFLSSYRIELYIPIICLDAPLYTVNFEEGKVSGFVPISFLLTDLVLSSWPGPNLDYLVMPETRPIILVTNPQNLERIIEEILSWHNLAMNNILQFAHDEPQELSKLPLRSMLTRMSRRKYRLSRKVIL